MNYSEHKYTGESDPWRSGFTVANAVPGYWEDMTETFQYAEFFKFLKINPSYGVQRYPIRDYCPDMALPNIMGNFFYRRGFICKGINAPVCLHIGGVQNAVSAWINGSFLGRHEGYSTPVDFVIPEDLLKDGENTVTLSISNLPLEGVFGCEISGLTNRAACAYTGGIWGDVELRVYNSPLRDIGVVVSDDCSSVSVSVEAVEECECTWSLLDGKNAVKSGKATGDFSFDCDGLEKWSPENPKLYTLIVESGEGSIERKIGVRRLKADGVHFKLNGKPYYLRGVCEHCYYPISVHPNRDLSFYRNIIKKMKELGFNYIRCHTFVPDEEYMQAADELGMLFHIESPNNTTLEEWKKTVTYCRRHPSVVIYCCGNELQIHDKFLAHLEQCADEVHARTDSLFSPMSALRGFEYCFEADPKNANETVTEPMRHNPRRFAIAERFCDLYNSYTNSQNSYLSLKGNPAVVDSWSDIYKKPRLSHEICINGTYADLSLKDRYKGSRIGATELLSSVEKHLEDVGILHNAPTYFKNSCQWQRRVRKHCFENTRLSENLAGYDFLGPIDTHWHTFGYDVGMMNEFYELKPTESVRNVRMYNSPTVVLTDLGLDYTFESGTELNFGIFLSHYGEDDMREAKIEVKLISEGGVAVRKSYTVDAVPNGHVTKAADCCIKLPMSDCPESYRLYITADSEETFAENEWEIYTFPKVEASDRGRLIVSGGMSHEELKEALKLGNDVLFLGNSPFVSNSTTFQIALAGRTAGNLATVIYDHPVMRDMTKDSFCSWQFRKLLEGGKAVCFTDKTLPFKPVVEVVSTHKYAVKQAALFEFKAYEGRVIVCTLNFTEGDPAAAWLKNRLIEYAKSDEFDPDVELDGNGIDALAFGKLIRAAENSNYAFNPNDVASSRKK